MCQYPVFETIAIINGEIKNLEYHQQRLAYTFEHLFNEKNKLCLSKIIQVPAEYQNGLVRCRVDYCANDFNVKFYPYQKREIKNYQCVYVDNVDYCFKYTNRTFFDNLIIEKDEAIIIKNGYVSDCRIGNLLFLKENRWYSPKQYLLKGTQLRYLLETNQITLKEIKAEDIHQYEKILMINALNPFDEQRAISTQHIDLSMNL